MSTVSSPPLSGTLYTYCKNPTGSRCTDELVNSAPCPLKGQTGARHVPPGAPSARTPTTKPL